MKITARLYFDYGSNDEACAINDAVRVDNGDYVRTAVSYNSIKAEISSENLSSFTNTLDDFLACLTTAENVVSAGIKRD